MSVRPKDRDSARIRGWILRLLEKVYPDGLEETDLEMAVRGACRMLKPGTLDGFVVYLQEKGYLLRKTQAVFDDEVTVVRLTVNGKDLLEGSAPPDRGVSLAGPVAITSEDGD